MEITGSVQNASYDGAMRFARAPDGGTLRRAVKDGPYAWLIVVILLTAYANAYVDRQLVNLLVLPVKAEFRLTETGVSLLLGFAFVAPLALFAPLAGRLADMGRRRSICVVAILSWSLSTLLCGFSRSYEALFAFRMLTGACEALLVPAAWSIIADYFSRAQLPRAMSIFMLGPYIGSGLALVLGGLVVKLLQYPLPSHFGLVPWRVTFMVAGFIGILPVLLVLLVREPGRPVSEQHGLPKLQHIFAAMRDRGRFYGPFYAGMALLTITFSAVPAWMPSLLARRFGTGLGEIGLQYGTLTLVAGCAGVLSGPMVGGWIARRGHAGHHMLVALIACVVTIPVMMAFPLIASYRIALAASAFVTFIGAVSIPMTASALQIATPCPMRGVAASLYVCVVAIVGVALPPILVALLTDHVFHDPGMVRWSLSIVCSSSLILATFAIVLSLAAYRNILVSQEP